MKNLTDEEKEAFMGHFWDTVQDAGKHGGERYWMVRAERAEAEVSRLRAILEMVKDTCSCGIRWSDDE